MDALVYAPRVCGICSVSQSVAAARALAAAQQLSMPPNGELAVNLVHATENVADHLTHFYLFFMPDFARDIYAGESWHAAAAERFAAITGTAAQDMLPARAPLAYTEAPDEPTAMSTAVTVSASRNADRTAATKEKRSASSFLERTVSRIRVKTKSSSSFMK